MAEAQKKFKVLVSLDLGPEVMPLLYKRSDIEVNVWPHGSSAGKEWLVKNIAGADGVICMLFDKIDEEVLDAAGPSLRVVSTMSVGYDHVDLKALAKRGIRLGNTPDVLTESVADSSVMLALMAGRNSKQGTQLVEAGEWPGWTWSPYGLCGPQISPNSPKDIRTVGFIGFGRIAQATLARMIGFGYTRCLYVARSKDPARAADIAETIKARHPTLTTVKSVEVDELARESDVLYILAPGGAETYHIVDEKFLKQMKKTAVLVNNARGTLVDSVALAKALKEGWIWGAGLDVVEGEPNVGLDHPLVKEPRCVIIPHIGSATWESRIGMATVSVENLLAGLDNKAMTAEVQLPK